MNATALMLPLLADILPFFELETLLYEIEVVLITIAHN